MQIDRQALKIAAEHLEENYPGTASELEAVAKASAEEPTKKDVVQVLMATGASFSIAASLWKLYQAANQLLGKIDPTGKSDQEILELVQKQLYDDYLKGSSANAGTIQAIIRALMAAAVKRSFNADKKKAAAGATVSPAMAASTSSPTQSGWRRWFSSPR